MARIKYYLSVLNLGSSILQINGLRMTFLAPRRFLVVILNQFQLYLGLELGSHFSQSVCKVQVFVSKQPDVTINIFSNKGYRRSNFTTNPFPRVSSETKPDLKYRNWQKTSRCVEILNQASFFIYPRQLGFVRKT